MDHPTLKTFPEKAPVAYIDFVPITVAGAVADFNRFPY
jgi:hypothetical protein